MKLKTASYRDTQLVTMALAHARRARDLLVECECEQAAKAMRVALKSVDGARRHVDRRFHEALYPKGVAAAIAEFVSPHTPAVAQATEREEILFSEVVPVLPDLDLKKAAA